jgi:hypothetical protein
MKEMVNKDKMVFFALLICVISYFGYINFEHCITDLDFYWFLSILFALLVSAIIFYKYKIVQQIKDDEFDGGRYWLSLYKHKN